MPFVRSGDVHVQIHVTLLAPSSSQVVTIVCCVVMLSVDLIYLDPCLLCYAAQQVLNAIRETEDRRQETGDRVRPRR